MPCGPATFWPTWPLTTGPLSPCATSTTCRYPTSLSFCSGRCTAPKPCSDGPGPPSDVPMPPRTTPMPDPFEALRRHDGPVDPDPTFAARLRARVERALSLPEGVTVSNLTVEAVAATDVADPSAPGAVAVTAAAVVPYLIVDGARRALDWYVSALGATRRGEPIVMADGRIGHGELELRGSVLYLADESAESQVAAPRPGGPATVSFAFEVPDVDASVDRAVAAGAVLERPLADNPYGRNAVVRDPFGHRWIISSVTTAPSPVTAGPDDRSAAGGHGERVRSGDIGYVLSLIHI